MNKWRTMYGVEYEYIDEDDSGSYEIFTTRKEAEIFIQSMFRNCRAIFLFKAEFNPERIYREKDLEHPKGRPVWNYNDCSDTYRNYITLEKFNS